MYKVAILGHSFVSGLEHHLRNRGAYTAEQVAEAMKMTMYVLQVFFFGSRGASVTNSNFVFPFVHLQRVLPTVVVFNYGTNDLANNVPPLQAAVKVVDMAKDLLTQVPSVKHVMVLGACYRKFTVESFTSNVHLFNTILHHLCEVEPQISSFMMRGFWKHPIDFWSRDGIHPNTPKGREIYISTLKSATFTAISTIKNGQKKGKPRRRKAVKQN